MKIRMKMIFIILKLIITYSLKVIGAVQSIAAKDLEEVLSKDAVLSLGLATYALEHNA